MKRQTISQRWYTWTEKEPLWAYAALISFLTSMAGLGIHLGGGWICASLGLMAWVGIVRTIGLFMLIGFDVSLLGITAFRKQWWWFSFFCYVTFGVLAWEVASYFFGSLR
jgi:NADH:ubiquinone oxidoreductase subunit 6 (subunit J)